MRNIIEYSRRVGIIMIGLLIIFLLNPFEKAHLFGYLLTAIIYTKKDFILKNLDLDYFFILLFSLVYSATYYFNQSEQGIQYVFIYAFFPSTFYLIGKKLVLFELSTKGLFYILFCIGFIFSISALISVLLNLYEGGFVQFDRTIPMFWTGKPTTATLMGAYFTFNMCIPAILVSNGGKLNLFFKAIVSVIFISTLLCVFRLGSRTQMVISGFTLFISLLYVIPNQTMKSNLRLLILITISTILILNFFSFDPDAEYMSTLGQRLQESDNTGSAGNRTGRWAKSIENIINKPLGWSLNEFGYSHNLWLDVARYAGISSFLLLIVITIRSMNNLKKILKLRRKELLLNTCFLLHYVAVFLVFFVEPIMEGIFYLFVVFCLYQGIIKAYYENLTNNHIS